MRIFLLLSLFISTIATAQVNDTFSVKGEADATSTELSLNEHIKGTLLKPKTDKKSPIVLLFTGSGPNDRDGNSQLTKNDSHKQLAEALFKEGIATYRYDKRIFTQIKARKIDPNIMFDDYVTDARTVVNYFTASNDYSKVFLAGHSQGSLIAMLASNDKTAGIISIAGAGEPIDNVIVKQIGMQAPGLDKKARETFNKMKAQEEVVTDFEPALASIFNTSTQPFMKSWMKYDPVATIKEVKVPLLIVNGDKDRQVDIKQAQLLQKAAPDSKYKIIEDMNHVLKVVGEDDIAAAKSYTDPSFPLHRELVTTMVSFINGE